MVGLGCALKYFSEAPNSSALSEACPAAETSACVCTSIATRSPTFMPGTSALLVGDLGRGHPVRLGFGADARLPRAGDGLGRPAAVREGHGLLAGVGPERQPVAADADGLAGHLRGGVGGEVDDERRYVLDRAQALVPAQPLGQRLPGPLRLLDDRGEDRDRLG